MSHHHRDHIPVGFREYCHLFKQDKRDLEHVNREISDLLEHTLRIPAEESAIISLRTRRGHLISQVQTRQDIIASELILLGVNEELYRLLHSPDTLIDQAKVVRLQVERQRLEKKRTIRFDHSR